MTLGELFSGVVNARVTRDAAVDVAGLSIDSRKVERGDLFFALPGRESAGTDFIVEAQRRGAVAVVADENSKTGNASVLVSDLRSNLGAIASRFYAEPSRDMTVVGITGTNGKSTVAVLLEAVLRAVGRTPGYVGTLAYRWGEEERTPTRTTPEATDLHRMLRDMANAGVTDVVIECSSHGLEFGRLNQVDMDVAMFTNLTAEHLDFHQTMERYRDAKWKLFDEILARSQKERRVAVINVDDSTGREWIKNIGSPVITFGTNSPDADVSVREKSLSADGIRARVSVKGRDVALSSPLIGHHNLSNLLAVMAASEALNLDLNAVAEALVEISLVRGRLEAIPNRAGIQVYVDYAHTADALSNVFSAVKEFCQRRMIVVFGCGGDRDQEKRPKMGEVVSEHADIAVVTSDNPRSENPDAIIDQIFEGIPSRLAQVSPDELSPETKKGVVRISDRRKAIERVLSISQPGDLVLIAGKGHETYQEISGVFHPFDDRDVVEKFLGGKK